MIHCDSYRRLSFLSVVVCVGLFVVLFCSLPVLAVGVTSVIGGNVSEPLIEVLCLPPSFCARIITPDWTNKDRFYGTDASNCRISETRGRTWANCPSNPSLTSTYLHYAVASDGSVLSVGNDSGGTVLRIRRSIDRASSWSTVYNSAPVDLQSYSLNGRLRCARTSSLCTFIFIESVPHELISNDNGQTWALDPFGPLFSVFTGNGLLSFSNDGLVGQWAPSSSDGFSNFRSLLWNGIQWLRTSIWPTTSGGQCNWNYVQNGLRRTVCHTGASGTIYNIRDETGVIQSSFSLPDVPSDNGGSVGLSVAYDGGAIWLLRLDVAGSTGMWSSEDGGVTFAKRYTFNPPGGGMGNQGSVFKGVDNCMYLSWALPGGATSTVARVCY